MKRIDSSKKAPGIKCNLCGTANATVKCDQCVQQLLCPTCDDMFHRHPKRQAHTRKVCRMYCILMIYK